MPRVAARRILLLALGVGIVVDVTVPGHQAGLNAVVVMVALLGAACVAAGRDGLRRFDPADAWLPAGAIWLAAMAVIRADSWLVAGRPPVRGRARRRHDRRPRRRADHPRPRAPRARRRRRRSWRRRSRARSRWCRPQEAVAGVEPAGPADDGRSIRDRLRPWLPVVPGPADRDADPARVRAPVRLRRRGLRRPRPRRPPPADLDRPRGPHGARGGRARRRLGRGRPVRARRRPPAAADPGSVDVAGAAGSIARRRERRRPRPQVAERWARPRRPPSSSPSTRCSPRSSSSSSPTCSVGATRSRSPG